MKGREMLLDSISARAVANCILALTQNYPGAEIMVTGDTGTSIQIYMADREDIQFQIEDGKIRAKSFDGDWSEYKTVSERGS
jgi:hypothetical protein